MQTTNRRRRQQYQYRLQKLQQECAECEQQRQACIGARATLAQQLSTTQTRMLELQAEADRVALLKGGQVVTVTVPVTLSQ
jgi:hypothetical protein